ncbi:C4-dicarboxylate TRAP transporter substrate-binding protein [Sneathiella sp.]|uniref:C4-dicarboxylate TRAP transporter substrate-binding protein n=1 Tax=Sneathiella sp. TaxID=1964365 RepID=UPI0035641F74
MRLSAVLMMIITAVGLCAGTALAETKIVYANYLGLKHTTNPALERFFARVTEETNGNVVWEPHFAGSLLGGKDIPSGVRDGIADGGYMVGVFVPSEMPVDNFLTDFSVLNDDALALTGAINELVLLECKECDDEYREEFKVQHLGTYALTDYLFQCTSEIRSLKDFKNKKVAAYAAWAEMAKGMDAIPVNVPSAEYYEALDRGVIDCAIQSITNQRTRSMGEVAHNVILNSLGGYVGGSLMNVRLDKWNELSASEKTAVLKNVPELISDSIFNYINLDIEVRAEMEAKGNKFYEVDEDLASYIKNFRENYVKTDAPAKGKERGVESADEIGKTIVELRAKWIALLDERGRDPKTFQKLLWEEIYSKVPTS